MTSFCGRDAGARGTMISPSASVVPFPCWRAVIAAGDGVALILIRPRGDSLETKASEAFGGPARSAELPSRSEPARPGRGREHLDHISQLTVLERPVQGEPLVDPLVVGALRVLLIRGPADAAHLPVELQLAVPGRPAARCEAARTIDRDYRRSALLDEGQHGGDSHAATEVDQARLVDYCGIEALALSPDVNPEPQPHPRDSSTTRRIAPPELTARAAHRQPRARCRRGDVQRDSRTRRRRVTRAHRAHWDARAGPYAVPMGRIGVPRAEVRQERGGGQI